MLSAATAAIGTVGGSFIDAGIGLLVEKLWSKLTNENFQFDDEFLGLKDELRYMMNFLKDVEKVKRNQRTEILKTIMADFRELVYDAEDIIDDYNHQFLTQSSRKLAKPSSSSSASSLNVSNQLKQQLQRITQSIKRVKDQRAYLGIAGSSIGGDKDWINGPLCYPILSNEDELVGLKDDLQKIMQWFPVENESFRVIGIVGMGGIGKTTLAEKIYGEAESHFTHKLFVTVSQNFRLEELIKSMLRKLHVPKESMEGDARDLIKMLKSNLFGKYFIVLDDVWGVDEGYWWQSLRSGLPQINGSCVIVTTRNEEVAKSMGAVEGYIHRPNLLSHEDSWSLFSKTAFPSNGGHCPNERIKEIGREIVSKCGRLPLAIKIMGGMMLAKGDSIHQWKQVLEQLNEGFAAAGKAEPLISTLELSYEELPAHLKPCLLCFAAYPEDKEINMSDMIYWWMGEEFIRDSDAKTALDLGKECLMELANRCLIIGASKDGFENGFVTYKLHDIVREMIINIARAENFIDIPDRCTSSTGVPSRRVCITTSAKEVSFKSNSKLRTLVLNTDDGYWNGDGRDLSRLRILFSVSGTEIRYADWIGSLRHLTYLYMSCFNQTELPDAFGSLQCLRVLRVSDNQFLRKLPSSLFSLKKLRVFEAVQPITCELGGLENFSSLHRLWVSSGASFKETKELKKLTELRELSVRIEPDDDAGEVLKVLADLPRLKVLAIWSQHEQFCNHQLSPFLQLEELRLYFWGKTAMPAWITPITLPNLRLLRLPLGLTRGIRDRCPCERLCSNRNTIWMQLEALKIYIAPSCFSAHRSIRGSITQGIEPAMPSLRFLCHSFPDRKIIWRKQNGLWTETQMFI